MKSNTHDADMNFIAEALPAFISEAHEQLQTIEQLLLELEACPGDRELLDALFRCAHTVKGSAGIFGLDKVVAFTHHVETLLDKMREGTVVLGPALSTLLLECKDQILHLVDSASQGGADTDQDLEVRADLITQLCAAMGSSSADLGQSPHEPSADNTQIPSCGGSWLISVHFGPDCFRNGMDPLSIIRYLGTLGSVQAIACDLALVPPLDQLDPESCHLGFELRLQTLAERNVIEEAFSFVRDDCTLRLVEPSAALVEYEQLLEAMPDRPLLGDILVKIGAISPAQLAAGLHTQEQARGKPGALVPRLGDVLQLQAGLAPEVVSAALSKQGKREATTGADDNRYIRVQADRLDEVINLLGELVIAAAGAALQARQTHHGELIESNQHIGRLIEEIRNGTLQLRMVPIGETFSRFRRVVRDTASSLGKEVTLEIVGGETELDKSVVERIADPLMHLVRNGLDHGLETPDERIAAGKPPTGTLVLSARHESGSILIRIEDDGRGINRDRVLQRAWDRGLVEKGVTPHDADILKLIFEPGFSTAEQITNLSGRGVGMDVVRRNIEALRGTVVVSSTEGVGSQINIRLPLTLAIIDGFLVSVGSSKFIFPLDTVVEVIENRPTASPRDAQGRSVVELRGEVLPVVCLRSLYGLDSVAPERVSVVVVQCSTGSFGVLVDTLLGQHQTVIKPLGRLFKTLRGISGSSILGNGEVALIFDVVSLGQLACEPPASRSSHRQLPAESHSTSLTSSERQAS